MAAQLLAEADRRPAPPHLEAEPASAEIPVAADGSPYWLRSERQTLRKLPRTGAVLFGIRVQLAPVGVLRARPDVAADLLAVLESWDDPMRRFKAAGPSADGLRRWLRTIAG